MSDPQKALADLYFESGTVKFGVFKIAAHESQPDLPLTPIYMHYPKDDEEGANLLSDIFKHVGDLFAEIITRQSIEFTWICAIPSGADPLATETANSMQIPSNQILLFSKQLLNGKRVFSGPLNGNISFGETVLVLDDHTSGGYTKSLFIDYLESLGARVTDVLTVVDRQQGAVDYLAGRDVNLHSIFTADNLLSYYHSKNLITSKQLHQVKEYLAENQIKI